MRPIRAESRVTHQGEVEICPHHRMEMSQRKMHHRRKPLGQRLKFNAHIINTRATCLSQVFQKRERVTRRFIPLEVSSTKGCSPSLSAITTCLISNREYDLDWWLIEGVVNLECRSIQRKILGTTKLCL